MEKHTQEALFAAGCFWGVEDRFMNIKGVVETEVGYTGGHTEKPTYEAVCGGDTGHAEAVRVVFDPSVVSYDELVRAFFGMHNPTTLNRQGPDVGEQYRSAIFTSNDEQRDIALRVKEELDEGGSFDSPIVTEITPASTFYPAEEYHQKYFQKNGGGVCAA